MASTAIYGTVAELNNRINKTTTSTIPDADLLLLITAASRAVDNICNRPDGFDAPAGATARIYTALGRRYCFIDECVAITLVEVKDSISDDTYTAWAATDWEAFSGDPDQPDWNSLPYDALMVDINGDYALFTSGNTALDRFTGRRRRGYNQAVPTVRVTARWGYSDAVPDVIREAALMQATRWYKRYQGAMSDTVAGPDFGTLLYRQVLDPDIRNILVGGRFVKPAVGRR